MRCTNKRQHIAALLLGVFCTSFLGGCSSQSSLEDAFSPDRAGLGIQSQKLEDTVSYFAEDLCVTNEDVEWMDVDTSDALAACFFKLDTKEVLYAQNIHKRVYPASTTKVLTALVALKHGDLDAQTVVSKEAITFNESGVSTAKLKEGDVLTLRQLMHALLLPSANDAANVIAEQIGGSIEKFAEMMNEEAQQLGATNSHFVNANGLHNEEHYTTVYDLYLIFQEAIKSDEFLEILRKQSFETSYLSADGSSVEVTWKSTNQFTKGDVTVPEGVTAVGGKTGTTMAAMSCLVQLFEDEAGDEYVAIILGCKERAILYREMQSFLSNLNK